MKIVAILPARGGSKGIPDKNIRNIAGRPLIYWSIKQALACSLIDSVWVSSDSQRILDLSQEFGANGILRPPEISGDNASSEAAWMHGIREIERISETDIDVVVAMQVTSPIRETADLDNALSLFFEKDYDSLLSVSRLEDHFRWRLTNSGPESINYDFRNRQRRQNLEPSFLENGSFYIFKAELLRLEKNRLGGKIGFFEMSKHKMFQIDSFEDLQLCEIIMRGYNYAG